MSSDRFSIVMIALGTFALGMASYVTAGLIPLIEADFHVSVGLAAQLVTAFTLAYGIGSPLLVAVMPAHAQRTALLSMLALFVLANAASALASDMWWLLALRVLAGAAAGTYLAIGTAAAVALAPAVQRGRTLGLIMGGMASGTVLGVPLGLQLAERWGWPAALWLIAVLGLVAFVGLALRLPALPAAAQRPLRAKLAIVTDTRVASVLAVSLLAAVASLGLYTFIAPLIRDLGGDAQRSVTPFLWIWGVGGVAGSFLVGPVLDRMPRTRLTLLIMLTLGAALLVLPAAIGVDVWLAVLPIAVWGAVGWALQVPQNATLLEARETSGDGNLAVALNESALYLGSAIGAGSGGLALSLGLPVAELAWTTAAIGFAGAAVHWTANRAR